MLAGGARSITYFAATPGTTSLTLNVAVDAVLFWSVTHHLTAVTKVTLNLANPLANVTVAG